jgi:hypothetical protein
VTELRDLLKGEAEGRVDVLSLDDSGGQPGQALPGRVVDAPLALEDLGRRARARPQLLDMQSSRVRFGDRWCWGLRGLGGDDGDAERLAPTAKLGPDWDFGLRLIPRANRVERGVAMDRALGVGL